MYKVFYNNRPVYLCRDTHFLSHPEEFRILSYTDRKSMEKELDFFEKTPDKKGLVLTFPDEEELFGYFCESFHLIHAAGGLVRNEAGEILMIKRRNIWDLPKGKLHRDESPEEGGIREVSEETGIGQLEIEHFITDSYHTFIANQKACLKKTSWYLMKASSNSRLIPQTEEDITEVKWFSLPLPSNLPRLTYASILEVLKKEGLFG